MLDRTAEREVISAAQSFGLAIIPWGPFCGGLLTGKPSRPSDPQGRWQDGKDNMNREATPLAWDVIELLRTIAADKRCSVSPRAFAWCVAQPGITPIIGPRTFEQVEDNLAAANVALEPKISRG
jgi:aryl-alcohol dehydrogenase-like predicted oxidoreductase